MQRKTSSRERILRQAFILFQKNGYTKTTTRMIAKASGVNEATIFNNFGSKANLFHEIYYIVPPSIEQVPIQDLTCGRDLYHDLFVLISSCLHLMIDNFPMYRFSMPLIDTVKEDLHVRSYTNIGTITSFFVSYFQFLASTGVVRNTDFSSIAHLLQSTFLIRSFDLVRAMPDENNPLVSYDEEAADALITEYCDYLYNILLPERTKGNE